MKQVFVLFCLAIWVLPALADSHSKIIDQVAAKYDALAREVRDSDDAFNQHQYKRAFQLYKKTAIKSLPFQEYRLAEMYFNGFGVKQDITEANKWYALAKSKGITSDTPTREKIRVINEIKAHEIKKALIAADLKEKKERSDPAYIQKSAVNRIRYARATIKQARADIDRQNRIGKVSGYVNEKAIYRAGSYIVSSQDEIEQSYAEYKKAGGKLALKDIQ